MLGPDSFSSLPASSEHVCVHTYIFTVYPFCHLSREKLHRPRTGSFGRTWSSLKMRIFHRIIIISPTCMWHGENQLIKQVNKKKKFNMNLSNLQMQKKIFEPYNAALQYSWTTYHHHIYFEKIRWHRHNYQLAGHWWHKRGMMGSNLYIFRDSIWVTKVDSAEQAIY